MNLDHANPKVYAAIAACIATLAKEGISKGRKNEQQGYSFRGIDDIYNSLASVLAANGLCIIPRVLSREITERQTQKGGTLFYVVVDVEFDIVSAADGSKHTAKVCGEAMDSGDKATNKAMSAAYKYMALQLFCIPTEGDNDADAISHPPIVPSKDSLTWMVGAMNAANGGMNSLKKWFCEQPQEMRDAISKSSDWSSVKAHAAKVQK